MRSLDSTRARNDRRHSSGLSTLQRQTIGSFSIVQILTRHTSLSLYLGELSGRCGVDIRITEGLADTDMLAIEFDIPMLLYGIEFVEYVVGNISRT